jgi:hypothetical protein
LRKSICLAATSSVLVVSFNIKSRKIIMKTRMQTASSQKGFSLLTGFILAIVMFGSMAFFLAGQGINSSFGSTYANTAKVSSMLTSAGYLSTGFDSVTLNGTPPLSVTFDTGAKGIFNPTTGGATVQNLDPSMFVDVSTQATATLPATGSHGYWIYRKDGITLNAVGTATSDFTVVASGLNQGTCQQINTTLTGSATIPALTIAEAALVGVPAAASNNTVTTAATLVTTGGTAGRPNGCYSTNDGTAIYVYIHTLLAQ